ncbi:MAG: hypothetical protein IT449_02020 [Phycisphaerales bacterium]|nr:hypothetical protein [Phycisphaerales bacterium]
MHRFSGKSIVGAGLACLFVAGAGRADSRLLSARNDPHAPNYFSVEFPPEFGGTTTADIVSTHFAIEVDENSGTASIVSWFQHVNPLLIGGQSTGDITVVLEGGSHGAYTQERVESKTLEGEFRTEESYAVHFTGDLSGFGIESPFVLPGASTGRVKFDEGDRTGRVSMNWSGEGSLGGIPFTYICAVNAVFDTGAECDGVSSVRASCRGNDLRVVVRITDDSHDGQSLVIEVGDGVYGGDPVSARIIGSRAKVRLANRSGEQTVRVLGVGGDCVAAQTTSCP